MEKASIDARRISSQAQLDADNKKADAKAELEKAKVDADKKQVAGRANPRMGGPPTGSGNRHRSALN